MYIVIIYKYKGDGFIKKVIRCDEKEMDLIVKSLQNFRTDILLKNNFTDAVDEIYLKIVSKFYKIK